MRVAIFAGTYGAFKPSGAATGPAIVALNLAKALNRHSGLEFKMHVQTQVDQESLQGDGFRARTIVNEPRQPNVERLTEEHFRRGYLDNFDAIHILSGRETALRISDMGYAPIIGTNVVYSAPNPKNLGFMVGGNLEGIIRQEMDIDRRKWALNLTPNEEFRQLHSKRSGMPQEKVIAFPCGIDTELFKPDGNVERDLIVASVPGPNKGGDLVLELAQHFPNEKWALLGKDEPYSYGGSVKYFQRAKVYISASRWESQGIATMEAVASGAPLIYARQKYATDGNGAVERDPFYCTEAGLVVGRNVAELKSALELLLGSTALREQMSNVSRQYIVDNFTLKGMAQRYEQIVNLSVGEANHALSTDSLFRNGVRLREEKMYDAAIAAFKQVAEREPTNFNAYANIGMAYRDSGQRAMAIQYFQRALEVNPNHQFSSQNLQRLAK